MEITEVYLHKMKHHSSQEPKRDKDKQTCEYGARQNVFLFVLPVVVPDLAQTVFQGNHGPFRIGRVLDTLDFLLLLLIDTFSFSDFQFQFPSATPIGEKSDNGTDIERQQDNTDHCKRKYQDFKTG
jgi:hypothetical protein